MKPISSGTLNHVCDSSLLIFHILMEYVSVFLFSTSVLLRDYNVKDVEKQALGSLFSQTKNMPKENLEDLPQSTIEYISFYSVIFINFIHLYSEF